MDLIQDLHRRITKHLRSNDTYPDGVARQGPEWLILVINNFCNLKCKMCDVGLGERDTVFYAHLIGEHPGNISLAMVERIAENALAFSPPPKIGLAYTEPLIHAGVLDLCRAIVGRGLWCSITTNGFLLPRLARALVEIGVQEITVSIDGPAEIHDRVRGRKGSFANLYTGVERLNQAKADLGRSTPVVRFSYTITDENYTQMRAFARQVEPLQPASLNFSHLNFIDEQMAVAHNARYPGELAVTRSNLGHMDLAKLNFPAMWAELQALQHEVRQAQIVPKFASLEALERYYREPLTFTGGRVCTDPWKMLLIRTDGTVIPAHGRCYQYVVGHLDQQSLIQIWNGERFRSFRQLLYQAGGSLPACSRCCGVIGK